MGKAGTGQLFVTKYSFLAWKLSVSFTISPWLWHLGTCQLIAGENCLPFAFATRVWITISQKPIAFWDKAAAITTICASSPEYHSTADMTAGCLVSRTLCCTVIEKADSDQPEAQVCHHLGSGACSKTVWRCQGTLNKSLLMEHPQGPACSSEVTRAVLAPETQQMRSWVGDRPWQGNA